MTPADRATRGAVITPCHPSAGKAQHRIPGRRQAAQDTHVSAHGSSGPAAVNRAASGPQPQPVCG